MAGTLNGLSGIRAGRNLRIKPYISTSGNTVGQLPTEGDFDGGVDVKYGVTTGLVWDFTVNTDFSQVEADEQQVNLTRFSLFFPEKRDFFLENAGMFDFGSTGGFFGNNTGAIFYGSRLSRVPQMRLFFSRRRLRRGLRCGSRAGGRHRFEARGPALRFGIERRRATHDLRLLGRRGFRLDLGAAAGAG